MILRCLLDLLNLRNLGISQKDATELVAASVTELFLCLVNISRDVSRNISNAGRIFSRNVCPCGVKVMDLWPRINNGMS